jgi:hypothetical protein
MMMSQMMSLRLGGTTARHIVAEYLKGVFDRRGILA